jgi:SAM-dependent methyltransferase
MVIKSITHVLMRGVRGASLTLLLFALASPSLVVRAQQQERRRGDRADAVGRPVSEPYTGALSIFEDTGRADKLQINRVMDILRVREGAGVADIGAGSGWFTVRAARRVGAGGAVYAVEINPDYIAYIERRAKTEGLPNIRTVLGRADDPLLPARSVDAVMILKTYHEIEEPIGLLRRVREALKPGGRLGIIDRDGTGGDHGIRRDDVVREAGRAGFRLVEEHDFVKPDGEDYYLVFEAAG